MTEQLRHGLQQVQRPEEQRHGRELPTDRAFASGIRGHPSGQLVGRHDLDARLPASVP
jgi:hypothetical protein